MTMLLMMYVHLCHFEVGVSVCPTHVPVHAKEAKKRPDEEDPGPVDGDSVGSKRRIAQQRSGSRRSCRHPAGQVCLVRLGQDDRLGKWTGTDCTSCAMLIPRMPPQHWAIVHLVAPVGTTIPAIVIAHSTTTCRRSYGHRYTQRNGGGRLVLGGAESEAPRAESLPLDRRTVLRIPQSSFVQQQLLSPTRRWSYVR